MARTLYKAVGKLGDQIKTDTDLETKELHTKQLQQLNTLLDSDQLNLLLERQWTPDLGTSQGGGVDGVRQYHLTLAAIHTERNQFSVARPHLGRLVRVEQAQAKVEGRPPRPQAQVATLLAQGRRAAGNDKEATKSYLEASWGYLLADDAKNAKASLAKIGPDQLDPDSLRQYQLLQQSIELEKTLIENKGEPSSPEWRRLAEIHAAIQTGQAETTKAWSADYIHSVPQRAEIALRKAGKTKGSDAWQMESKKLPPLRNGKAAIPPQQIERERKLKILRNPALERKNLDPTKSR